jgi:uncharacterized repeat protein (TIGR01451 family)
MNINPKENLLTLKSLLWSCATGVLFLSSYASAVDHFVFDAIASPQFTNIPFTVAITAVTSQGTRDTNFTGSTGLSGAGQAGAILVQPSSVGPFVSGAWTGTVQVLNTDRFVQLQTAAAPGVSSSFHVEGAPYRSINLQAMDLVYDATRRLIYASVPNNGGIYSNSIVTIDPYAGTILSSASVPDIVRPVVTVDFRSGKLAISDDSQFLYVAVSNAYAVQRFNLASQTLGPVYGLGIGQNLKTLAVADMVVLPGSPGSVAVARADGFNARGVVIYDNGIPRSDMTPEIGETINAIEPSGTPNLLYGYNNQFGGFDLYRLIVNASGVSIQDSTPGLFDGFSTDIAYGGGRIFGSTGRVVDPAQPALLGTFKVEGSLSLAGTLLSSMVAPDSLVGRSYFATFLGNNFHIQAHDIGTLLPLKALDLPQDGGSSSAFIRWGTNGLALATTAGKIYLVQCSLLMPAGIPADLVVTQSIAGTPVAGSNFTISATVSNQGPEFASAVVLNDFLPTNCVLISVSVSQGSYSTNANGISCNFGMLAPGSNATLLATLRPAFGGWASNQVFAIANENDPALANNASTQEFFIQIDPQPNTVSQIRLPVSGLSFERNSQRLYASVPSRAGIHGNSLLAFNTTNWSPVNSMFVGNQPEQLAQSDDGTSLYVTVNSNKSVCRVDLVGQSVAASFDLTSNAPPLFVEDLAVLPGQSHSVAISRSNPSYHEAVAIYDDGVQRPNTSSDPPHSFSDVIEFGSDPSILFAHNSGSAGYYRLQVDDQGVTLLDSDPNLLGNYNAIELKYAEGELYSTAGSVIDPVAGLLKGKIVGITNASAVCFDGATRRMFFLQAGTSDYDLWAVEAESLLPLGTMRIPGLVGTPANLVRWGADGLAFRTTGDQLIVLRTSLLPTTSPADLRITTLAAPGGAIVGSNYIFSLQVTNAGPSDANHVLVTNILPVGSSVLSVSCSQGIGSNANGTVVCDLGLLTNGAAVNINVSLQLSQSGLFSFNSQVSGDAVDLTNANNRSSWVVWCSAAGGTAAQVSANLGINDIAADKVSGRVYASVSSSSAATPNTIIWFDPIAGLAGNPVQAGPNPDRLGISRDGNSLYVGLDDASAVQRIDTIAQTTAAPFSIGSGQTALSVAVDPNNASQVVIFRAFDNKFAAYVNGIKSVNELSGVGLLAFSGSNGVPFVCDGGHSGVPLYQATLDSSGLILGASQPAQQPATDLKSDGGLLFYNRGMIVDPDARRVKAMMPVPFNALVEPDVTSGRVYYLTPVGSGWTLRAFDLVQGIEIGSSPVAGILGNPKRMVRCGADAFAVCTDAGQIVIFRSSVVPTGNAIDLALSQTSSLVTATTNNNLTLLLTLTNKGPAASQSITVTQSFSLSVTSVTPATSFGSASFASNVVTWQVGPLTNRGFATLSVSLRPTQIGTLLVNAAARQPNNDPFWGNNVALSAINVTGPAGTNILQLRLATRELVYDPFRNLIYASLPATNQLLGNLVAIISPETGSLVGSLFAGSEPDQLALSQDGRYLYVALDGTMGVRRFDLTTQSNTEFPLSLSKLYNASDLKVQPGNPLTFAVSRVIAQTQSNPESVAVYDDATARVNAAGVTKPIVFSSDGSQIYGTLPLGSGIGFLRLQVSSSGVSQLGSTPAYSGDTDFDIANGLVYGTTGRVLDPSVPSAVGTNKATGSVVVDGSAGRAFYLTQVGANYEIRACQVGTYQSLGTNAIAGVLGSATNLIRCGGDRLAFRTTSNQVFIVRSTLVPASDLAITGVSTPHSSLAGQAISNFVAVTNFGPIAATNIFVTNVYTGPASVISATASQGVVTIGAGFVTWNVGTLASNAACFLSLLVMATNSTDGIMSNYFAVSASLPDPVTANNSVAFTNYLSADNDRDGMADTWELANGFDPSDPSDALLDADGDGQSNRNEYLAGTNPHDSTSALRITGFRSNGNSLSLTFSSVIGKSYVVERATALGSATWIAVGAPVTGTGGDTLVPISPPGGFGSGFYRVRLVQ